MKIRKDHPDTRGDAPDPPPELCQPGEEPDYRVALHSGKITITTILLLVWLLAFSQVLNNQFNPVHKVPNPAYQAAANSPNAASADAQQQTPVQNP